jgi:hypothetical protein
MMNNDFLTSSCSGGCSSCSICGPTESEMNDSVIKPLGKITSILADLGLEVTYAYDDLVFVQHSAFLLQFTDKVNVLKLYTNSECDPKVTNQVASSMVIEFDRASFFLEPSGKYTLTQNEDETLRLAFAESL